jgi:hypothetical protein
MSAAFVVAGAPARAADEPVTLRVGPGSLTVIAPEIKWSQPGSGCEDFSVEYRVAYPPGAATWWSVDGSVLTAQEVRADSFAVRGSSAGAVREAIRLCPDVVGYGSLRIAGSVRLSSSEAVPFAVPFTLTRMRTSVRLTKILRDTGRTTVRGRVRAYHPRVGWQPGEGSVRVEFKKPGSRWRGFGTTVASGGTYKGRFEWTRYRSLPPRTAFRARYLDNPKQEPGISAARRMR